MTTKSPDLTTFVVDDTSYETRLSVKFRRRKPWVAPNPKQLTAYIPGVIRAVHVHAGQSVRRGDPLLVLEAMKMQNAVDAKDDGRIKSVHVKAGDQVPKGQLLIEFE